MKKQTWKNSIGRFLTAQTISLFGSSLVQYAIIWHITLSTSSGKMLMISTICGFLPQVAISLLAGGWIDRYDRKKIIMLADGAIATATGILAVCFLLGFQQIWLLFAVLAIRSAGTGIQTPSVQALIPEIVPKEELMRINGIYSTLNSLMMFLSPAISGALLSVLPLGAALLVDVVTAVMGIGITATVYIESHRKKWTEAPSGLSEWKAGFQYLKNSPLLKRLLVFQTLVLFSISASAFLTPLLVSRTFGPEVWRLTASEMTYSLGMVLGGVLISTWGGFAKRLSTTFLAGAVYGVLMIGLGTAPWFAFYLICNLLIGITAPCYNTPLTVLLQETVEPQMQGRVFSFMQIASSCALPMGMVFFGPMADLVSVQSLLLGAGGFVLLVIFGGKKLLKAV